MRSPWLRFLKLIQRKIIFSVDLVKDSWKSRFVFASLFIIRCLSYLPEKICFPLRIFFCRFLPWDPLIGESEGKLNIFILTTKKDIDVLPFSLVSIIENVGVTNSSFTVVAPQSDLAEIDERISFLNFSQIDCCSDESLLNHFGLKRSQFSSGHSVMQILKFLCALKSTGENTLVLDGDTIFLRRRVWVSKKKVILVVPPEYQLQHVNFVRSYFPQIKHSNLGFTTQAQVIKSAWVAQLLDQCGGIQEVAKVFITAMQGHELRINPKIFPCEWQLYGDWVLNFHRNEIEIASYLNLSGNRDEFLPQNYRDISRKEIVDWLSNLTKMLKSTSSLSLHAYKD